jgi:parallel beta-helix repeat protein
MKEFWKTFIVLAVTCSLFVATANIEHVNAQKPIVVKQVPIVIEPDGTIQGTNKIQRSGDAYYLTGNLTFSNTSGLTSGIAVLTSNITLDGKGFTVQAENPIKYGILIGDNSNVTIRNFNLDGFEYGICLNASTNCLILGNTVSDCDTGILLGSYWIVITSYDLHRTEKILVINNTISDNLRGLDITYSRYTVVSGNTFTRNDQGMYTMVSNHNFIIGNSFIENNGFAIAMHDSRNNTLHHNNFINNKVVDSIQIYANWYCRYNAWDNGSEGNYWSEYSARYPNATMNSSGVWNIPFYIKEYNSDLFPLSEPIDITVATIPEFPSSLVLILFLVTSSLILLSKKVWRAATLRN